MTTPATGNAISLGDIADEFGITPKVNISLRGRSDAADFDTPDFISEFYSYTHTAYSFSVTIGYPSALSACSDGFYPTTIYGDEVNYFANTRFWADATFETPFNGSDSWYSDGIYSLQINSNGEVTDTDAC